MTILQCTNYILLSFIIILSNIQKEKVVTIFEIVQVPFDIGGHNIFNSLKVLLLFHLGRPYNKYTTV